MNILTGKRDLWPEIVDAYSSDTKHYMDEVGVKSLFTLFGLFCIWALTTIKALYYAVTYIKYKFNERKNNE